MIKYESEYSGFIHSKQNLLTYIKIIPSNT